MFSPSSDINPCHSLFFDRDHLRSNMGIISCPGSFAVRDHLRSWDHLRTRTHPSCSFSVWGLIYLLMSRHEEYGYEKLICYGLKCMFYHMFEGLSTEQDDENSHNCVCHSMSHRKYKHCRPCRNL